ncbi:MAG: FAD-dependent oxidoreductase [Candidatus Binatia bacterium]|nr:FAD-dependent oxidoreductase [Candidatus Binatia bacterium]
MTKPEQLPLATAGPDPHGPVRERIQVLRGGTRLEGEFILYWMRTAVRAHENPALDAALLAAEAYDRPVFVYHALSERYPFASDRHHRFILEGARDVQLEFQRRSIGYAFHLERPGHRSHALKQLATRAALVVTEDFPTPPMRQWLDALVASCDAPVWTVDTACVVPMRLVPGKPDRAFAYRNRTRSLREARVGRPWVDAPSPGSPFVPDELPFEPVDLERETLGALIGACEIDHGVAPVPETPGGSTAGYRRWQAFLERDLDRYSAKRNDPCAGATSRMSAYLHYGHVSPMRLAREAAAHRSAGARKFLDELLVWRELAYTWCWHEQKMEELSALPHWAQNTLVEHHDVPRSGLSWERLARGRSGDALWDAAQTSLLVHGELHNNLRMTWGKAIPPWRPDPKSALEMLLDLNHRYALDGRDPASYGGLLWCLGLFDRPFPEAKTALGTIRSRSTRSQERRIDTAAYLRKVERPRASFNPKIAVIGGGIAGLACARTLQDHGLSVVVVDKGRGPGGRTSSRRTPQGHVDHGAQFFHARGESLRRYVRSWAEDGIAAAWDARFLGPSEKGAFVERHDEEVRWVGTPSMSAIARHLASELDVRRDQRVLRLERHLDGWRLETSDDVLGPFDQVVLSLPARQTASLLTDGALRERLASVRYAPCLAVATKFPVGLDLGFDAARFGPEEPLSWVARDASKPRRTDEGWWILHAAPDWSRDHLERDPDENTRDLLACFAERFDSPPPDETFAHRWRYALVETPLGEPCLADPEAGWIVCGDGCLGGRLEAAWDSGIAAAGRLLGEPPETAAQGVPGQ